MKLLAFLLLSLLDVAVGSSRLVPKLDSASCTGNATITLISASCGDEPCTFGSDVSIFAQLDASTDIPRSAIISVKPALPHFPSSGVFAVTQQEVDDICMANSTTVIPPAGNDAGYSCPSAGLYNIHSDYTLWGNESGWYATAFGYNMGVVLKIKDVFNGNEYASCYVEIKVQKGEDDYTYNFFSASFIFPAVLGIAGVGTGLMVRRRRTMTVGQQQQRRRQQEEDEAGQGDKSFELMSDAHTPV